MRWARIRSSAATRKRCTRACTTTSSPCSCPRDAAWAWRTCWCASCSDWASRRRAAPHRRQRRAAAAAAAPAAPASRLPAASATTQQNFIQGLWPQAQQAAQQLGVDPTQSHRPGGAGDQLGPQSAARRQRSFQQQSVWRQGHGRLGRRQCPGRDDRSERRQRDAAESRRSARMRTPPRAFRTMSRSCVTTRVTPPHSIPAPTPAPSRPGCNAVVMRLTRIMPARSAPSPTTSPATWP